MAGIDTNEDALDMLVRAIEAAEMIPGEDIGISVDIAASEFGKLGRYTLGLEKRELDGGGMVELLSSWVDRYPIVSIEDPLGEDDPDPRIFTQRYNDSIQIIGDDFLVTMPSSGPPTLAYAIPPAIKPNSLSSTVTETSAALDAARNLQDTTVVSTVPARPKTLLSPTSQSDGTRGAAEGWPLRPFRNVWQSGMKFYG